MVNFDIVNYLVEGMHRGYDLFYLQQILVRSGFLPAHVEEAVTYVVAVQNAQKPPQDIRKSPSVDAPPLSINPTTNTANAAETPLTNDQTLAPSSGQPAPEKKGATSDVSQNAVRRTQSASDVSPTVDSASRPSIQLPAPPNISKAVISPSASMVKPATPDEIATAVPVSPGTNPVEPTHIIVEGSTQTPTFFQKIALGIVNPNELFRRTKTEGMSGAIVYWMILTLMPILFSSTVISVRFSTLFGIFGPLIGLINSDLSGIIANVGESGIFVIFGIVFGSLLVFTYLIGTLLTLIYAALHHIFVKLYGGLGGYGATYTAMIYSATPIFLLGGPALLLLLIPVAGAIIALIFLSALGIWSLALLVMGTSTNHRLTVARSVFVWLSVLLLFFILGLGFFLLLIVQGIVVPPSDFSNFTTALAGNFSSGNGTG